MDWKRIDIKSVPDSDGFMTDYALYKYVGYEPEPEYVCVFGDTDIYRPEDGYYDWEGETEEEAREWFDNYEGFADESEWNDEDLDIEFYNLGESYNLIIDNNNDRTLVEKKLKEGMLDTIRAAIPENFTPTEFAKKILKLLGADKFGTAVKDTFIDIYSTVGADLKNALAKLVDNNVKAQIIKRKLPETKTVQMDERSMVFEDLDWSDEDFDVKADLQSDVFNALADIAQDYSNSGVELTEKDFRDAVEFFIIEYYDSLEAARNAE